MLFAPACDPGNDDASGNDESQSETDTDSDGSTEGTESSSESSSEGGDDTTSSSDGNDTSPSVCECILDQPDYEPPALPTCGEPICDAVMLVDGPDVESGEVVIANPEALDCALTALRDRTPGLLRWSASYYSGIYEDAGYVLIYAAGDAVHRGWGQHDLDYFADPALRFELLAAEHYDACLADPDPIARYDCMIAAPASELELCDAGWSASES
ncbi:hypothetical protein ACNOYE_09595 [Nannocystaceae bacterium ST9]